MDTSDVQLPPDASTIIGNPWDNDPIAGVGGGGPLPPVKSPDDAAALKEMAADLNQKQLVAQRAQAFMRVQGTGPNAVATGPGYGDIPIINHVLPNIVRGVQAVIDPATSNKINQLDAISGPTWEQLRPKGSGPIRQYEAQGLKAGFPNAGNWGDANAAIASRLQSEYQDSLRQMQFAQNYVRSGKGGVADAVAAYQNLKNQQTPRAAGNAALQQRSAQSKSGGFGYLGPG